MPGEHRECLGWCWTRKTCIMVRTGSKSGDYTPRKCLLLQQQQFPARRISPVIEVLLQLPLCRCVREEGAEDVICLSSSG